MANWAKVSNGTWVAIIGGLEYACEHNYSIAVAGRDRVDYWSVTRTDDGVEYGEQFATLAEAQRWAEELA